MKFCEQSDVQYIRNFMTLKDFAVMLYDSFIFCKFSANDILEHFVTTGQLVRTSHELGIAVLDIVNAYPEHSGMYTLKISTVAGEAATSATVKVLGESLCLLIYSEPSSVRLSIHLFS